MAFIEDIDVFFADFSVIAIFSGESANVILDMPEQVIGEVISAEYQITYKTGNFAELGYGDTITVDSIDYKVDEVMKQDDGKITIATLSKV